MIKVTHVTALKNFELKIELSNGESGIFDVAPYLNKGIFSELKNPVYFSSVSLIFGGIAWPNGQDFSADTIAHEMRDVIKRAS